MDGRFASLALENFENFNGGLDSLEFEFQPAMNRKQKQKYRKLAYSGHTIPGHDNIAPRQRPSASQPTGAKHFFACYEEQLYEDSAQCTGSSRMPSDDPAVTSSDLDRDVECTSGGAVGGRVWTGPGGTPLAKKSLYRGNGKRPCSSEEQSRFDGRYHTTPMKIWSREELQAHNHKQILTNSQAHPKPNKTQKPSARSEYVWKPVSQASTLAETRVSQAAAQADGTVTSCNLNRELECAVMSALLDAVSDSRSSTAKPFMPTEESCNLVGKFEPIELNSYFMQDMNLTTEGEYAQHLPQPPNDLIIPLSADAGELSINEFEKDEPKDGNIIAVNQLDDDEWEVIWLTADSGAAVSMLRTDQAISYDLLPTKESQAGVSYTAAKKGKVYEQGKRMPVMQFESGALKALQFRVGPVNKALLSIKDIVSGVPGGNRVVFDDEGSFILNKTTGEITPLYERNRTYGLPVRVLPKPVASKLQSKFQKTFQRQASKL